MPDNFSFSTDQSYNGSGSAQSFPTYTAAPAAAAAPSGGGWLDSLIGGIGKVATPTLQTYSMIQGQKLAEKSAAQANALAIANANALSAQNAAPWYQQAWVKPVAMGAGVLFLISILIGRRR